MPHLKCVNLDNSVKPLSLTLEHLFYIMIVPEKWPIMFNNLTLNSCPDRTIFAINHPSIYLLKVFVYEVLPALPRAPKFIRPSLKSRIFYSKGFSIPISKIIAGGFVVRYSKSELDSFPARTPVSLRKNDAVSIDSSNSTVYKVRFGGSSQLLEGVKLELNSAVLAVNWVFNRTPHPALRTSRREGSSWSRIGHQLP